MTFSYKVRWRQRHNRYLIYVEIYDPTCIGKKQIHLHSIPTNQESLSERERYQIERKLTDKWIELYNDKESRPCPEIDWSCVDTDLKVIHSKTQDKEAKEYLERRLQDDKERLDRQILEVLLSIDRRLKAVENAVDNRRQLSIDINIGDYNTIDVKAIVNLLKEKLDHDTIPLRKYCNNIIDTRHWKPLESESVSDISFLKLDKNTNGK